MVTHCNRTVRDRVANDCVSYVAEVEHVDEGDGDVDYDVRVWCAHCVLLVCQELDIGIGADRDGSRMCDHEVVVGPYVCWFKMWPMGRVVVEVDTVVLIVVGL